MPLGNFQSVRRHCLLPMRNPRPRRARAYCHVAQNGFFSIQLPAHNDKIEAVIFSVMRGHVKEKWFIPYGIAAFLRFCLLGGNYAALSDQVDGNIVI